jgi:hypothetical protein
MFCIYFFSVGYIDGIWMNSNSTNIKVATDSGMVLGKPIMVLNQGVLLENKEKIFVFVSSIKRIDYPSE